MKLYIQQKTWSTWSLGNSGITNFIYDLVVGKKVVVKNEVGRSFSSYDNADFSFMVLEIGDDFVKIETNGNAGGYYDEKQQKYKPIERVFKVGEVNKFYTNYFDVGANFSVELK